MNNQMKPPSDTRISWVTLILCLCLGSLVVLPLFNLVCLSVLEISEIDFDEDVLMLTAAGISIQEFVSAPFSQDSLKIHTASLSPDLPPPRSA